jgi:hypothetical protein
MAKDFQKVLANHLAIPSHNQVLRQLGPFSVIADLQRKYSLHIMNE